MPHIPAGRERRRLKRPAWPVVLDEGQPSGWRDHWLWPEFSGEDRLSILTAMTRFTLGDRGRRVRNDLEYLVWSGIALDRGDIMADDLTPGRMARWEREHGPVEPYNNGAPYVVVYNYDRPAATPDFDSRMSFNMHRGVIYATLTRKLFPYITGQPIPAEPTLYVIQGTSVTVIAEATLGNPQEPSAHSDDIELAIRPLPNS